MVGEHTIGAGLIIVATWDTIVWSLMVYGYVRTARNLKCVSASKLRMSMSEDRKLAACKIFKSGGSLTDIQRELKMSWGEANEALRWGLSRCDLDNDAIRSMEQYRKKYFPLSAAEAEREYANCPSIPLSDGERQEIVKRVTSKGRSSE